MIKLNLNGWQLTHVDEPDPEVQQYDNETSPLVIVGDIPAGWSWQALIAYDELLNVVLLTPTEDGLEAQMSASDLALAGIYTIQLRSSAGTAVRRTNKVSINVPSSLNGDAVWPEVPSAFSQAVDQAQAAAIGAAASASAAASSESASALSESNAAASAAAAAASESAAATSESNALASADRAAAKAENARQSELSAQVSRDGASQSAQFAQSSATSAWNAVTRALNSATQAETAASAASGSAGAASDSADAAAASATSAAESAAIASAMINLDFYINGSGHLIAERSGTE